MGVPGEPPHDDPVAPRRVAPARLGQGRRLFPDSGRDTALELVESRATANGVTIQVYRTAGRPQYG